MGVFLQSTKVMSLPLKAFNSFRSRGFSSIAHYQVAQPRSMLPTQITRAFHSTPFVWSETSIKVAESVDAIEKDLSVLFKEAHDDPEVLTFVQEFQMKKQKLLDDGLQIIESEESVKIQGEKDGRKYVIEFNPTRLMDEDEDEDYGQSDYEDENTREPDEERDPDETESDPESEDEPGNKNIALSVTITKQGAKDLFVECAATTSGELLIYRIGSSSENLVVVSELSDDIQHKVYDYLEELGIGDGTAAFVGEYVMCKGQQVQNETIKYVSDFFSK